MWKLDPVPDFKILIIVSYICAKQRQHVPRDFRLPSLDPRDQTGITASMWKNRDEGLRMRLVG
jgi:hypothetical protein